MLVVNKKPVPIYEVECHECSSIIQYKKSEAPGARIFCPVCGVILWVTTINPVRYEEATE